MAQTIKKVALVGNPNSGKSTLFNALTGLNQKVGNFPGVTVDKKTGIYHFKNARGEKQSLELVDLPGTYSLFPKSMDEKVSFEVLCDPSNPDHPDLNIIVADSSNLERSLYFASQVIELRIPAVLALNMEDVSRKMGINIDVDKLSEILGVPVVKVSARNRGSLTKLHEVIQGEVQASDKELMPMAEFKPNVLAKVGDLVKANSTYAAFQVACNYPFIGYFEKHPEKAEQISAWLEEEGFKPYTLQARESQIRYQFISDLVKIVQQREERKQINFTEKLDNLLTHPILGFVAFLGILFLMFQAIFTVAEKPMEWIEYSFTELIAIANDYLPAGLFTDVLTEGVLAGLSGVLVFIPQIAFLFLFIGILEDTGYMARASLIVDSFLRKFGMNGRSVIPMVGGFACAIPAIMATRSISNWKERLITIFITPFMSCSARLPVYTLLISLVIPSDMKVFGMNVQGLTLLALYLLGIVMALISGWVLKRIIKADYAGTFVMEMPTYKWPDWRSLFITIWEKVRIFIWDAGKIIVAISIVLWFLSSYGPTERMEDVQLNYEVMQNDPAVSDSLADAMYSAQKLENSYAGILGKSIEPAIQPLGYDWKLGIALITSFAAREVFVGTLATLFSVGDPDDEATLREKMRQQKSQVSGAPMYGLATGLSLMVFYAFALQCMSTLAIVKRETNGWKWPIIQFFAMGAIAYLASLITYQAIVHWF